MRPTRRTEPAGSPRPAAAPDALHFCAVCQVSVTAAELVNGAAQRSPKGRVFCGVCARATPEERTRRREALENEFADDAPVSVPALIRASKPAPEAPPPAPSPRSADVAFLEARVGELERAAFRLQSRVATLEEKLGEALRRLE